MTETTDKYRKAYHECRKLIDAAFRISISIQGKEVESRELEIGSRLFAKIISHTRAILLLAPKGPAGIDAPTQELWDISSLAALARSEIDAYYVFFYVAMDEVNPVLKSFRWLVWDYHAESRRLKKLQLIGSTSPAVAEIVTLVNELKAKIMRHEIYLNLEAHEQKKLRDAKEAVLSTNTELSGKARIDEAYYKNVFMFLSSYVHSHPFSVEQLTIFRAGDDDSLNLIKIVIEYASIYLSLSLRDFTVLVPGACDFIDEETQNIIDIWVGVVNDFTKNKLA